MFKIIFSFFVIFSLISCQPQSSRAKSQLSAGDDSADVGVDAIEIDNDVFLSTDSSDVEVAFSEQESSDENNSFSSSSAKIVVDEGNAPLYLTQNSTFSGHLKPHLSSITSSAPILGKWRSNITTAKRDADKYGIPLVVVWSNGDKCSYCVKFKKELTKDTFVNYRTSRQILMVYGEKTNDAAGRAIKQFVGTGSYPLAAVYWNGQKWKFTSRYKAQQFIDKIESYISGYQTPEDDTATPVPPVVTPVPTVATPVPTAPSTIPSLGTWVSNINNAKVIADTNQIPMVVVWSSGSTCSYCVKLDKQMATSTFTDYMARRKLVMVHGEGNVTAEGKAVKSFVGFGQYPLAAVYWKGQKWQFSARYTAQQFIDKIESYISGYQPPVATPVPPVATPVPPVATPVPPVATPVPPVATPPTTPVIAAGFVAGDYNPSTSLAWTYNAAAAKTLAKENGTPLVIMWGASSGCSICTNVKSNILQKADWKTYAWQKGLSLLYFDQYKRTSNSNLSALFTELSKYHYQDCSNTMPIIMVFDVKSTANLTNVKLDSTNVTFRGCFHPGSSTTLSSFESLLESKIGVLPNIQ